MFNKTRTILLIIALLLGAGYYFRDTLKVYYNGLIDKFPVLGEKVSQVAEQLEKEISTPLPLRVSRESSSAVLTETGVISETNKQRSTQSLPPLERNLNLEVAALLKARDMLAGQYFEHVSPSGVTVSDLADQVSYDFLAIGENLALGNFEGDADLVQAWMDSPGHRANILSNKYQEIGVAVIKGEFEGRSSWLAVQEFGRPISSCPAVKSYLLDQIRAQEEALNILTAEIEERDQELKKYHGPRDEYNKKVEEYNNLVAEYNQSAKDLKQIVAEYNDSIQSFNTCLN